MGKMVPNQHVSYDVTTAKLTSTYGDIEKYVSWRKGKLIFKNDSIDQILRRLSRWYNVEFELKDSQVKSFTYTATFIDETLNQILDLMEIATPINYSIEPRKELPDGSYSKQKVAIGVKTK